ANHRLLCSVVIPRRNPFGLTFWPIRDSLLVHGSDHHGDVAGALLDLEGSTLCTRLEPLHGRALIDECGGDDELALIEALPRLICLHTRAGDRGLDELEDGLAGALRCEPQGVQGLGRALATNQVHNAASLHGRHAEVPHLRLGFHCCPAFFWVSGRAVVLSELSDDGPFCRPSRGP